MIWIYDPWADSTEAQEEYGLKVLPQHPTEKYDGVIVAVAHDQFKNMSEVDYLTLSKPESVIYDLKYVLDRNLSDLRL